MSIVLLDTDVVSVLMKDDSRASSYASLIQGERLDATFMTAAELFQWAAVRKWGPQRVAALEQTLATYLIVPVDVGLCRLWGDIRAARRAAGLPIAPQDAWIAATALRHGLSLITHDPSDYAGLSGIDVRSALQI